MQKIFSDGALAHDTIYGIQQLENKYYTIYIIGCYKSLRHENCETILLESYRLNINVQHNNVEKNS